MRGNDLLATWGIHKVCDAEDDIIGVSLWLTPLFFTWGIPFLAQHMLVQGSAHKILAPELVNQHFTPRCSAALVFG